MEWALCACSSLLAGAGHMAAARTACYLSGQIFGQCVSQPLRDWMSLMINGILMESSAAGPWRLKSSTAPLNAYRSPACQFHRRSGTKVLIGPLRSRFHSQFTAHRMGMWSLPKCLEVFQSDLDRRPAPLCMGVTSSELSLDQYQQASPQIPDLRCRGLITIPKRRVTV